MGSTRDPHPVRGRLDCRRKLAYRRRIAGITAVLASLGPRFLESDVPVFGDPRAILLGAEPRPAGLVARRVDSAAGTSPDRRRHAWRLDGRSTALVAVVPRRRRAVACIERSRETGHYTFFRTDVARRSRRSLLRTGTCISCIRRSPAGTHTNATISRSGICSLSQCNCLYYCS